MEFLGVFVRESDEQANLVRRMTGAKVLFAAVCNEQTDLASRRRGRRLGAQPGVPDLLVFDPPPNKPKCVGMAIEMKRKNGSLRDVRPDQTLWLANLERCGWHTVVAFGCDDALVALRSAGYKI